MRGFFYVLMPLYVLFVTLLLAPVTVEADAELTREGGHASVVVRLLALRLRLPFRASFALPRGLAVWRLTRGGKADCVFPADKKGSGLLQSFGTFLRTEARLDADLCFVVGAGDAARTALICGALTCAAENAAKALLPRATVRVHALPQYDFPCVRVLLQGITRFRIADVIRVHLEERRCRFYGASTRNHHAVHRGGAARACGR